MTYRIVYFGSGDIGLASLKALQADHRLDLVAVVTQPPKPVDRGNSIQPTPIGAWAESSSVRLETPSSLKQSEIAKTLRQFEADCFVIIAYGLILPEDVLQIPRLGSINVHASLLPKFRGASPIPATILAGEQTTGISIMQIDAGVDTGPILAQFSTPVEAQDTALSLAEKISRLSATHLPDTLVEWLSGQRIPQPQPSSGSSYAPKLRKNDGRADWRSGFTLERKIRAFTPWPGVWTEWNGHRLKLLEATFAPGTVEATPGSVLERSPGGWMIACGDGYLLPKQVQFAGRKAQPAEVIPGSYKDFIGSRLA